MIQGTECQIGQHTVIAEDVRLGDHVQIGNNVTLYPGVEVGDRCVIFDGAVIGRPPMHAGNITRQVSDIPQRLLIGEGSIVGANAVLYTDLTIGPRSLIGDLATIREGCTFGEKVVIGRSVMVMYQTQVGDRTRVIDGAILTGNMLIEADVFIGPGANSINDNQVYLRRFGLIPFEAKGPVIRRFATLGAGCNIAAEVEIGMGAVVAPSAMVTQDVLEWSIVGGVPAREIGSVDPDIRAQVLAHFGLVMPSTVS